MVPTSSETVQNSKTKSSIEVPNAQQKVEVSITEKKISAPSSPASANGETAQTETLSASAATDNKALQNSQNGDDQVIYLLSVYLTCHIQSRGVNLSENHIVLLDNFICFTYIYYIR